MAAVGLAACGGLGEGTPTATPDMQVPAQYATGSGATFYERTGIAFPLHQLGVVDRPDNRSAFVETEGDLTLRADGGLVLRVRGDGLDEVVTFAPEDAVAGYRETDTADHAAAVELFGRAWDGLRYAEYGYWSLDRGEGQDTLGAYAFAGLETPAGNLPAQAALTGSAFGQTYGIGQAGSEAPLVGTVTLTVDPGTGRVHGTMAVERVTSGGNVPWTTLAFSAVIPAGANGYAGTTRVTVALPDGVDTGATGTIAGKFFGPAAEETAGYWTLSDGTHEAAGSFGAAR